MSSSGSLANEAGSSSGIQQVMGGSSSGPSGVITRAQSRGRAEGAESRTPFFFFCGPLEEKFNRA